MARKKGSTNKPKLPPLNAGNIEIVVSNVRKAINAYHDYHASIKVFGKPYEASGANILEAIANLPVKKAGGVTVLVIQKGDERQEKILPKLATIRLFAPSQAVREQAQKFQATRFSI